MPRLYPFTRYIVPGRTSIKGGVHMKCVEVRIPDMSTHFI